MILFLSHCFAAVIGAVLMVLAWWRMTANPKGVHNMISGVRNSALEGGHCQSCHRTLTQEQHTLLTNSCPVCTLVPDVKP